MNHQHNFCITFHTYIFITSYICLKSGGHSSNNLFSIKDINILANVGLRGNPIPSHSIIYIIEWLWMAIYPNLITDAFNNLDGKHCEIIYFFVFAIFFWWTIQFLSFFSCIHGGLKACEIFWCPKFFWMLFLVPMMARHDFIKK